MIPGMPLGPQPQVDTQGHRALSSASELGQAGADAHHFASDQAAPVPAIEHSEPPAGFRALLDAARVSDVDVASMEAWLLGGADTNARPHDQADGDKVAQELTALWGDKAPREMENVRAFLQGLPADEARVLLHARDSAGRLYANSPEVIASLAGVARARGGANGELSTVAGIERYMRTNRTAYNRDEALQARYRELLAAREGN